MLRSQTLHLFLRQGKEVMVMSGYEWLSAPQEKDASLPYRLLQAAQGMRQPPTPRDGMIPAKPPHFPCHLPPKNSTLNLSSC